MPPPKQSLVVVVVVVAVGMPRMSIDVSCFRCAYHRRNQRAKKEAGNVQRDKRKTPMECCAIVDCWVLLLLLLLLLLLPLLPPVNPATTSMDNQEEMGRSFTTFRNSTIC